MSDKAWFSGKWYLSECYDAWFYRRPGYYEPSLELPDDSIEHKIDSSAIRQLIQALDEAGWIKPRLDERLRAEDLKITHRLLDIIEKS